ncbi:hypothetical protein CHUAL_002850 [Chamberlinius hualienensis]
MDYNQFSSDLFSKIESLKKLLEEDSSINITAGEHLILTCLYTCDGDVEKTKEKIITYFQYKKRFPRIMKGGDMLNDNNRSLYRKCILTTDVNQEKLESPLVMVCNLSNAHNINGYEAVNNWIYIMYSVILNSERIRQHGIIVIINMDRLPFNLLFQLTPKFLYEGIKGLLFVPGDLLKKIIVVNAGVFVAGTVRICQQMLPSNINEMVVIYNGSWDCLKDEIPSESLPIEFGGTNGTAEECIDHLLPIMTKWRDVIINHF